ncbi:hypothetical protein [Corallibacter sp.]|uniref:hypothetical protein n=1 Tax=Corallibacter sp. TaxID=2038084 RepID=UPI003AB17058
MKKLFIIVCCFVSLAHYGQTTIQYPQRATNNTAFFNNNGGNLDKNIYIIKTQNNSGAIKTTKLVKI